jgi:hypothetical protein
MLQCILLHVTLSSTTKSRGVGVECTLTQLLLSWCREQHQVGGAAHEQQPAGQPHGGGLWRPAAEQPHPAGPRPLVERHQGGQHAIWGNRGPCEALPQQQQCSAIGEGRCSRCNSTVCQQCQQGAAAAVTSSAAGNKVDELWGRWSMVEGQLLQRGNGDLVVTPFDVDSQAHRAIPGDVCASPDDCSFHC